MVDPARSAAGPRTLVAALVAVAAASLLLRLQALLPAAQWWQAATAPAIGDFAQLLVHESLLPRLVVAPLCGAALAMAGAIFQQVLRTELAEPATLGVSAGAFLALGAVSLWAPELAGAHRDLVCLAGAVGAAGLVAAMAWSQRLAPLALILAGFVVTLMCSAAGAAISLFDDNGARYLFIWGSGSLVQNDWTAVTYLLPRLVAPMLLAIVLVRPLTLLGLGDDGARALGLAPVRLRLLAVSAAVALAAFTVSAVGVIGFIGLAAPAVAGLAGARSFGGRLAWAALIGAALLLVADEAVQQAARIMPEVPTGAATALLGAPLLLVLLRRLRPTQTAPAAATQRRLGRPLAWLAVGSATLAVLCWLSLAVGPGVHGWRFVVVDPADPLLIWRWPRLGVAVGAGVLLAVSGTILQRMTANPMAGPELLGVSSGAACGIMLLVLCLDAAPGTAAMLASAALGAVLALGLIMLVARRSSFRPEQVLLAGVALNTIFAALVSLLLGMGDPRMFGLLRWMAGSTFLATPGQAITALASAAVAIAAAPLAARWLDVLPLGEAAARGLGLDVAASRRTLLLLAAVAAAMGTLLVGPLSFVGLMVPHMARTMGLARATPQLIGSALVGAILMAVADWVGRVAHFPNQLPVGIVATLVGAPYFMWLIARRR